THLVADVLRIEEPLEARQDCHRFDPPLWIQPSPALPCAPPTCQRPIPAPGPSPRSPIDSPPRARPCSCACPGGGAAPGGRPPRMPSDLKRSRADQIGEPRALLGIEQRVQL